MGIIANMLIPGRRSQGLILTCVIGITGAAVSCLPPSGQSSRSRRFARRRGESGLCGVIEPGGLAGGLAPLPCVTGAARGSRSHDQDRRSGAPAAPLSSGTIHRHVVWGAAITALGGPLFGCDTGVISGAPLFIGKDFHGLTSFDKERLTSIQLIGALAGALAAGKIADRAGRRPTVLGTAALFVAGVMLAAFSPSYAVLVGARVIIGLAAGSASMVVPLYIGEVAPLRVRGALVSFNQLAIASGILVSYLVDYGLASTQNWRLMFGLAAVPAILMFTGMLFQHESPHWLVARAARTRHVRSCTGCAARVTSTLRSPRCANCPSATPASVRCSARRYATS
jgi:Sugar (and other) transporter